MRELSVASKAPNPRQHNTADYVFENAASFPDRVALRRRVDGEWRDVSSAVFGAEVLALAKGLIAAGVEAGDRIALMSKTRYEWTLIDFAVLSIGAVVVPIYETSSAEQVEWILSDSGATAIFVETDAHEATVDSVRESAVAGLSVWRIEGDALADLGTRGADLSDDQVHKRREAVTPTDLASIIYTSGTTGRPKGCQLLHLNFITEVSEVTVELRHLFNEDTSTLLFLPIAHVFGRVIEIGALATGSTLGHTADVKNLIADLAAFQPTFILSVPRVFEKVYNTAESRAASGVQSKIFARDSAVL